VIPKHNFLSLQLWDVKQLYFTNLLVVNILLFNFPLTKTTMNQMDDVRESGSLCSLQGEVQD
jgi:hypothetical protein